MSRTTLPQGFWSAQKWVLVLAFVFVVQLGFIFWLSDKRPARRRVPMRAPAFRFASHASSELLSLGDPTLFALPHTQGFAGLAWLHKTGPGYHPFEWSEPPRWLSLRPEFVERDLLALA